jgi:hypothetical protein
MGLTEDARLFCQQIAAELRIDADALLRAARSHPDGVRRLELLLRRLELHLGGRPALTAFLGSEHAALRETPTSALGRGRLLAVELLEYQMNLGRPLPPSTAITPPSKRTPVATPVQLPMEPRVTVDLIPETSFFRNVRSHVTRAQWASIRAVVIARAGGRCERCLAPTDAFDCDEVWRYEGTRQILAGLAAVCKRCHAVKHFAHSELRGHGLRALRHMCKVNGWSQDQAIQHIAEAYATWEERSRIHWELDLSYLTHIAPSAPAERMPRRRPGARKRTAASIAD